MSKVKSFLGYTIAALMIPVALVALMGMGPLSELLVSVTGLEITPWFSGGDVVRTVDHDGYETRIHEPVFDALIGERREGFVQIDWEPLSRLPARIDQDVDWDNDGAADFRIQVQMETLEANLTPFAEGILGLEGVYRLEDGVAVRVTLRNPRR